MIFYIICVMSFVWQTGPTANPQSRLLTDAEVMVPRVIISLVLALGLLYLLLIGLTFRKYSDPMEEAWRERIRGWMAEKALQAVGAATDGHGMGTDQTQTDYWKPQGGRQGSRQTLNEKTIMHDVTGTGRLDPKLEAAHQEKGLSFSNEGAKAWSTLPVTTTVNFAHLDAITHIPLEKSIPLTKEGNSVGIKSLQSSHGRKKGLTPARSASPIPVPPPRVQRQFARPQTPDFISSQTHATAICADAPEIYAVPFEVHENLKGKQESTDGVLDLMHEIARLDDRGISVPDQSTASGMSVSIPLPEVLKNKDVDSVSWASFIEDLRTAWDELQQSSGSDRLGLRNTLSCIDDLNTRVLSQHGVFMVLVQYHRKNAEIGSSTFKPHEPCGLFLGSMTAAKQGTRPSRACITTDKTRTKVASQAVKSCFRSCLTI